MSLAHILSKELGEKAHFGGLKNKWKGENKEIKWVQAIFSRNLAEKRRKARNSKIHWVNSF